MKDKITKEQMAEMLRGRNIGSVVTEAESQLAKDNNLLIIHGYSDDGMILEGVFNEVLDCYNGKNFGFVEAEWCLHENTSWTYSSPFPHAKFDVIEDGEIYCVGIVIDFSTMFNSEK